MLDVLGANDMPDLGKPTSLPDHHAHTLMSGTATMLITTANSFSAFVCSSVLLCFHGITKLVYIRTIKMCFLVTLACDNSSEYINSAYDVTSTGT